MGWSIRTADAVVCGEGSEYHLQPQVVGRQLVDYGGQLLILFLLQGEYEKDVIKIIGYHC